MSHSSSQRETDDPGRRHKKPHSILIITCIAVAVIVITLVIVGGLKQQQGEKAQDILDPFYTPPPNLIAGSPGDIVRIESIPVDIPGARAWRMLYVSEQLDGQRSITSGMIIAPTGTPPEGGRPVIAWAHPTLGMGTTCAPSRKSDPYAGMPWLQGMIANGWVVAATDYHGLGTPGVLPYLVGRAEAHDVINSVRAAIRCKETGAGNRYAVWGHSQGGHAVLWAAQIRNDYARELVMVGAAAAAPAAELDALMSQQYDKVVAWVIGPELLVSWPHYYQKMPVENVTTRAGYENYRKMSNLCLLNASYQALIRENVVNEQLFSVNPMADRQWDKVAAENTPSPPGELPVLIVQGLADTVVLPNTTALLVERYYAAGSPLTVAWLGDVSHMQAGFIAGPMVNTWLQQRFAGVAASSTRGTANPVPAAVTPPAN